MYVHSGLSCRAIQEAVEEYKCAACLTLCEDERRWGLLFRKFFDDSAAVEQVSLLESVRRMELCLLSVTIIHISVHTQEVRGEGNGRGVALPDRNLLMNEPSRMNAFSAPCSATGTKAETKYKIISFVLKCSHLSVLWFIGE